MGIFSVPLSFALPWLSQLGNFGGGASSGGSRGLRTGTVHASLVKLDLAKYPDARCLDGSPGAYYIRRAELSEGLDNWVISLEGGGECADNATCAARSTTALGSSKAYPQTEHLTQFVSIDHEENPAMHSWNHVRVKYCSGDLHLGTMNSTDAPEWGWARFSGARIISAILQHLSTTRGLSKAKQLVWTGESAGGIAAFAHLDQVADMFPAVRVVGAPIAGYYWDDSVPYLGPGHGSFLPFGKDGFKALYGLYRMFVPRRCAEGPHRAEPWACGLADVAFDTLAAPVFVTEAQVDRVQLELHAGVTCDPAGADYPSEADYCLRWGRNMTAHLEKVHARARSDPSRAGLFSPACRIHVGFSKEGPLIDGLTYAQAFAQFLGRSQDAVVHKDDCCSGDVIQYQSTCPAEMSVVFA